jgi:hypothetical protein
VRCDRCGFSTRNTLRKTATLSPRLFSQPVVLWRTAGWSVSDRSSCTPSISVSKFWTKKKALTFARLEIDTWGGKTSTTTLAGEFFLDQHP